MGQGRLPCCVCSGPLRSLCQESVRPQEICWGTRQPCEGRAGCAGGNRGRLRGGLQVWLQQKERERKEGWEAECQAATQPGLQSLRPKSAARSPGPAAMGFPSSGASAWPSPHSTHAPKVDLHATCSGLLRCWGACKAPRWGLCGEEEDKGYKIHWEVKSGVRVTLALLTREQWSLTLPCDCWLGSQNPHKPGTSPLLTLFRALWLHGPQPRSRKCPWWAGSQVPAEEELAPNAEQIFRTTGGKDGWLPWVAPYYSRFTMETGRMKEERSERWIHILFHTVQRFASFLSLSNLLVLKSDWGVTMTTNW